MLIYIICSEKTITQASTSTVISNSRLGSSIFHLQSLKQQQIFDAQLSSFFFYIASSSSSISPLELGLIFLNSSSGMSFVLIIDYSRSPKFD